MVDRSNPRNPTSEPNLYIHMPTKFTPSIHTPYGEPSDMSSPQDPWDNSITADGQSPSNIVPVVRATSRSSRSSRSSRGGSHDSSSDSERSHRSSTASTPKVPAIQQVEHQMPCVTLPPPPPSYAPMQVQQSAPRRRTEGKVSPQSMYTPGPQPAAPRMQHAALSAVCRYLPFPDPRTLPRIPNGPDTPHRLFFGQMKYEATLEIVCWLIDILSKGTMRPVYLHRHGSGCAMVHMGSAYEAQFLANLTETVLFDHSGIWIAFTPQELEQLRRYTSTLARDPSIRGLPRGCMVIRP